MRKYFKYIIFTEIILLIIVIIIGKSNNKEEVVNDEETEIITEEMESIFSILPYEEESIAIYYYPDSKVLEIKINEFPYERNVEYALSILHKYKETKDYTAEDVSIVTPSFMYSE